MLFLIPVGVIFAIFFLYQHKNGYIFGPISFAIFIYSAMGLASIGLYTLGENRNSFEISLESMLYLSACLVIGFAGPFSYSDHRNRFLVIENVALLKWLGFFQIFTSVFAILFFAPFAFKGLTGNISDNRLDLQYGQEVLGSYGLFNSFFSLVGNLFYISIILCFVNLAMIGRGGSRIRAIMLMLSSGVYVLYVLAYVGRDGFVYWLMSYVFLYLLFRNFLTLSIRKQINRLAFVLASLAFVAFMLITISRFSERGSIIISLLDYSGSQIFYFNDHYMVDGPLQMGLINFKNFLEIGAFLGFNETPYFNRFEWFSFYKARDVVPWVFSTYIGSFLFDFGKAGTLFLVATISLFSYISLRRHEKAGYLAFSNIIIFVMCSQILTWGVFYYRQFSAGYSLVAMVIISMCFKVSGAHKKKFVIPRVSSLDAEG